MVHRSLLLVFMSALFFAGCASISDPFTALAPPATSSIPAEALAKTAAEIERVVSLNDAEATFTPVSGVSVSDPLVLQAIRTRTLRHAHIADILRSGHIYELPNGLIRIKTSRAYSQATTRQERDRNAMLVGSENNDRWTLYEGLIEENNWSNRALDEVRAVFFEARLDAMVPGEHYEDATGAITAKQ